MVIGGGAFHFLVLGVPAGADDGAWVALGLDVAVGGWVGLGLGGGVGDGWDPPHPAKKVDALNITAAGTAQTKERRWFIVIWFAYLLSKSLSGYSFAFRKRKTP